ncbi:MAG: hypothetical protein FGM55_15925 [Rhodoferax sp.]|nr:hypothetical protein [Rhodoferax sp.]
MALLTLTPALALGAPVAGADHRLGWSLAPVGEQPQQETRLSPEVSAEVAELTRQSDDNRLPRSARAQAAWLLGLIHLHGAGMAVQAAAARGWFDRAWSLGEPRAAAGLAWCAIDGCDGPTDPQAARRWLKALERVDSPRAQYLEWLMLGRRAPLPPVTTATGAPGPRDPADPATALLLQAARSGDVQALLELGLQALAADRPEEALRHFEAAAPKSSAAAANAMRLRGSRVEEPADPRSRDSATPESASAAALLAAAQKAHRGQGQPANYTEAIRLYRLADLKGSLAARRMLGLIYARPTTQGQLDVTWMRQLADLDLSGDVPRTASPGMRREPTGLSDWLPDRWRARMDGPTP